MSYQDELRILENLIKGRKACAAHLKSSDKRDHSDPKHSRRNEIHYYRQTSEMLLTAQGKPQAIVKIMGYYKGKKTKIGTIRHLAYLSRQGTLELEYHDGRKISTLEEQRELVDNWSVDFGDKDCNRNVMWLMLSAPPGSDREMVKQAACDFLLEEFSQDGYEYVFVPHDDTGHPHVHVAIKTASIYRKKLNRRKADLRKARSLFAEKCRHYGIDMEASSRYERGLSGKSKRSELVQMTRHGRKPRVDQALIQKVNAERVADKAVSHPSEAKMLKRNQIIRKRYAERANTLRQKNSSLSDASQQAKYQRAADLLDNYAKTMPVEASRGEKLRRQLDQKQGVTLHRSSLQSEGI